MKTLKFFIYVTITFLISCKSEDDSINLNDTDLPIELVFNSLEEEIIFFKNGKIESIDSNTLNEFNDGWSDIIDEKKSQLEKVFFTFESTDILNTNSVGDDLIEISTPYTFDNSILFATISNSTQKNVLAEGNLDKLTINKGIVMYKNQTGGGGNTIFNIQEENTRIFPLTFESTTGGILHPFDSIEDIDNDEYLILYTLTSSYIK